LINYFLNTPCARVDKTLLVARETGTFLPLIGSGLDPNLLLALRILYTTYDLFTSITLGLRRGVEHLSILVTTTGVREDKALLTPGRLRRSFFFTANFVDICSLVFIASISSFCSYSKLK